MLRRHAPIEWLMMLADGAAFDRRGAWTQDHAAACRRCGSKLEKLLSARRALGSIGPVEIPAELATVLKASLGAPRRRTFGFLRHPVPLFASLALALLGTVFLAHTARGPRIELSSAASLPMGSLEAAARDLHEKMAQNALALDLESGSPRDIRDFLARSRAPLAALSDPAPSGYVPVGALVRRGSGAKQARMSAVFYRMGKERVTLVAARQSDVEDAPAPGVLSTRVLHRRIEGKNAFTWSSSGQTYALLSDLGGLGEGACAICHASDRTRAALSRL